MTHLDSTVVAPGQDHVPVDPYAPHQFHVPSIQASATARAIWPSETWRADASRIARCLLFEEELLIRIGGLLLGPPGLHLRG